MNAASTSTAGIVAVVFVALQVGHSLGDHWVQTSHQADTKGRPGWPGRWADTTHVAGLTVTKLAVLGLVLAVTGTHLTWWRVGVGVVVDAVSHWWADRRTTLAHLAHLLGKGEFYALGAPRPGHDDAPCLGTGAYALDQSWHTAWLLITALILAA